MTDATDGGLRQAINHLEAAEASIAMAHKFCDIPDGVYDDQGHLQDLGEVLCGLIRYLTARRRDLVFEEGLRERAAWAKAAGHGPEVVASILAEKPARTYRDILQEFKDNYVPPKPGDYPPPRAG